MRSVFARQAVERPEPFIHARRVEERRVLLPRGGERAHWERGDSATVVASEGDHLGHEPQWSVLVVEEATRVVAVAAVSWVLDAVL